MSVTADQFVAGILARILALAPDAAGHWVAFSGGLDSHVLLHVLAALRSRLPGPPVALHVNHNLQADAPAWAEHARAVCAALDVECRVLSVRAEARPGESPEAAARAARYRALAGAVAPPGAVLLTAHHQDDQAETLLLQLLRGAGPKGLAAMPERTTVHGVPLLRPLLAESRAALHDYARLHELHWIDDPSNACADYDRNYLRHEVVPRLRARWPAAAATLARAARHQAQAAQLLDALALHDLDGFRDDAPDTSPTQPLPEPASRPGREVSDCAVHRATRPGSCAAPPHAAAPPSLSVPALLRLPAARRANLLRHWLHASGAPLPSAALLERVEQDLLHAAGDAQPLVRWGPVRLRRYRGRLYLDDVHEEGDPSRCLIWRPDRPLRLPDGVLTAEPAVGCGVALRHLPAGPLQVRFRRGGESLRPAGRREHHALKHLFQDAGVPPWERGRVPLIYRDDVLLAIAGMWVCAEFQALPEEPGMRFTWSRSIVPSGSIW